MGLALGIGSGTGDTSSWAPGPASEAIARGKAPTELAHAFEGKYRYGVTGSLVAYIDHTRGRATLTRLLRAASQAEILAALGTTEADLLAAWRASVK